MLTLDPTSEQAQYQLGLSLLTDHVTTALSYLDAAAVDPEYRASATAIRATITTHANDAPAVLSFQIALTLMSLKAWPHAEHAMIISMRQGPTTAAGLAVLGMAQDQQERDGWALFSTGEIDAARVELERALVLDPTNARARYYFAILLEYRGDTEGAINSYLYVYRDAADNGFKDLASGALTRLGYNVDPDKAQR